MVRGRGVGELGGVVGEVRFGVGVGAGRLLHAGEELGLVVVVGVVEAGWGVGEDVGSGRYV